MRHLAWAMLAIGCALPMEPVPVRVLDAAFYRAEVDPFVRVTCAALECHGVDGRALRLYAQNGLRMRAEDRGLPLTEDEAAWDAAAFVGVDPEPETVEAHIALRKPLAVEAGGLEHVADDVWATTGEAGYQCLRGWLAGETPTAACAAASEAR